MIDSYLTYQKSSVIAILFKAWHIIKSGSNVVSYENEGYYWVALLINDNFYYPVSLIKSYIIFETAIY